MYFLLYIFYLTITYKKTIKTHITKHKEELKKAYLCDKS